MIENYFEIRIDSALEEMKVRKSVRMDEIAFEVECKEVTLGDFYELICKMCHEISREAHYFWTLEFLT